MKKLVWFNSALLSQHASGPYASTNAHANYYWGSPIEPKLPNPEHLRWHLAMMKTTGRNISMTDFTGLSKKYGDGLNMANMMPHAPAVPVTFDVDAGSYVHEHFDQMVEQRSNQLFDHAEHMQATEIRICWSGGIDSSFILAAIMSNSRSHAWRMQNRIVIYTTMYARREDETLWNWVMQSGMPVRFLDYNKIDQDDSNWLMVTGDGEPYGTMFSGLTFGKIDNCNWGHWKLLEPWFLEKDTTGLAWDYFNELMNTSNIPVETCYHAWWRFETTVDPGQCYFYRMCAYSNQSNINPAHAYPGQKIFWFLSSQEFANHGAYVILNKLVPDDPKMIKPHLQEYTARWQGHTNYGKIRFFSQALVPKRIVKWRIYDDLSWDNIPNLNGDSYG